MKRTAAALWFGDLKTGDGSLTTHGGALEQVPYTFAQRFGESPGTNPEELIAAAHAGCYTMAVCAALTRAGFRPTRLSTQATVVLEQVEGAWTLTASHLEMRAVVPDVPAERFAEIAADAKANCPVSRALKLEITLDARLDATR
ncbi:MAG TPA: OsmC family protein [Steroidobacteraceae bacterium]|nr:OsmC family protein [Steroidobacteraceae bacterium]